jgi:hypothetical protein
MSDYSVNRLLALASLFEATAKEELEESEQMDPGSAYDLEVNNELITGIQNLIDIAPTKNQWMSWLETNKTSLGSLARLPWDAYDSFTIYAYKTMFVRAYITTQPDPPEQKYQDFTLTSQAVLKASPPFPTLWLFTGTVENKKIPLAPEFSHDQWLVTALQDIAKKDFDYDEFKLYFKKNKPIIDKIRKFFKSVPTVLGSGTDGIAFDIGGDRVLKLFLDDVSFASAMQAMHRLHKEPLLAKTEAMIYDAGKLGDYLGTNIYYYVIEKMQPVLQVDRDAASYLDSVLYAIRNQIDKDRYTIWQPLKSKINDPKFHAFIKEKVAKEAKVMAAQILGEFSDLKSNVEAGIPNLKDTWFESYIEEIMMKYLTGRTDLHLGNLGVTGYGELRYFDPSFANWTSDINIIEDFK